MVIIIIKENLNMKDIILCEYGCGQQAKFKTKGGRNICCKSPNQCQVNRKKNSQKVKIAHAKEPEKWKVQNHGEKYKKWRESNPDKFAKCRIKSGKTLKDKFKTGELIPNWLGKTLSNEHKQKISEKMYQRTCRGWSHCKYFEVFSPTTNEIVKVQGTWQLKYAEYLNQNNISWIRSRKINLKYRLHQDDYLHTYYPDFYLPEQDVYIEIKGRYQQQQRIKMERVIQQNKDKTIKLVFKHELESLLNQKL